MVAKLNNDSSMDRYDNMCVIPRKLLQKMLKLYKVIVFSDMKGYHGQLPYQIRI